MVRTKPPLVRLCELTPGPLFDFFALLRALADANIVDEALRRLVMTLLDRHADALKRLPASAGKFYPFHGGLLEHTLSVTHTCLWLVEKYTAYYTELQPPLNRDLV